MGFEKAIIGDTRDIRVEAFELIKSLQRDRGIAGASLTLGQVSLANWFIVNRAKGLTAVGDTAIVRLLTGEVDPGDALAQHVAMLTNGAVKPETFAQPFEMPDAVYTPLAAEGGPVDAKTPCRPAFTIRVIGTKRRVFIHDSCWPIALEREDAVELHRRLSEILTKRKPR